MINGGEKDEDKIFNVSDDDVCGCCYVQCMQ